MRLRNVGSNMTEITTEKGQILFSYETPVAALLADADNGDTVVKTSCKWSKTTSRHINQWLNGTHAELRPQSFFNDMVLGV